MVQKLILISFFVVFSLAACVARKDIILPTKYDRENRVASYKQCVAQATNRGYDERLNPDEIVQASMQTCLGAKNWMLKEYPKSWRVGMEEEVDKQVYKDEIAWILSNRD